MCQRASCVPSPNTHSHVLHVQVVVFYDTLLTFSREVEYVWKRKWSAAAVLFILGRYSAVAIGIVNVLFVVVLPLVRPVIHELCRGTYSCRGQPISIDFYLLIFNAIT